MNAIIGWILLASMLVELTKDISDLVIDAEDMTVGVLG